MKEIKLDRKHCQGCQNDYYNSSEEKGCWSRKTAKLEQKILIGVDEPPPYKGKTKKKIPSCWIGRRRIAINPKSLTKDGFWQSFS